MNIISLIQIDSYLLGASESGMLAVWDLNQCQAISSKSNSSVNLLNDSILKIKISLRLKGMERHIERLILFNQTSFYSIDIKQFLKSIGNLKPQSLCKSIKFCSKPDPVNSIAITDSFMLFGSKSSYLYKYNFSTQKVIQKKKIAKEIVSINNQLLFGMQQQYENFEITSVKLNDKYQNCQSAFIGHSSGILYEVSIQSLNQIRVYQIDNCQIFEPISSITFQREKVITIHQNFIIVWNSKNGEYFFKIVVQSPLTTAFNSNNQFIIPVKGPSFYLVTENICQVSLSTRKALSFLQIKVNGREMYGIGGIEGFIDVFQGTNRVMTFYTF